MDTAEGGSWWPKVPYPFRGGAAPPGEDSVPLAPETSQPVRIVEKVEIGREALLAKAMDKLFTFTKLLMLLTIVSLVLSSVILIRTGDSSGDFNNVFSHFDTLENITIAVAKFFQISQIVDDMHTKEVQCLTLLAECEALAISGTAPGFKAQVQRICAQTVTRCERMVVNHLEQLASLTFDPGACVSIGPFSDAFCYPQVQTVSGSGLMGLTSTRVGPSSAAFGPVGTDPELSMLNREEYGVYMAYSYAFAPNPGTMKDGIGYVSLNTSSPAFGRPTVMLESTGRGYIRSFYVDHERVIALALESNEIYHWDISVSVSLAVKGTTITSANIATGTTIGSGTFAGSYSAPWSIKKLASGDYVVTMINSTSTPCTSTGQCGGLMKLSAAALKTNPAIAPSLFDNITAPLHETRDTPGECAVLEGGMATVVCGSFGEPVGLLDGTDCPSMLLSGFSAEEWGTQVNYYTGNNGYITQQTDLEVSPLADVSATYSPKPVEEWRNSSWYAPNRIVQFHNTADTVIVVDLFGGAVAQMTFTGSSPDKWTGATTNWILPLHDTDPSSTDISSYSSPLLYDAILSPDDCMLYIAALGLGQVRAYSICDQYGTQGLREPNLCAIHQLSAGLTASTKVYTHASNPSRPLYGGPGNLATSPDGAYLYVSSSSVFDKCMFPDAIEAGGFMVRYRISTAKCNALSIDIDPGFFVDGNALPGRIGVPASINTIAFSNGDAKLQQVDSTLGY
jgi:hypothetical protein